MQRDLISETIHEELVHAADHRMAALELIKESRGEQTAKPEDTSAPEKDSGENDE